VARSVLRCVPALIVLALAVACGRGNRTGTAPTRPNILLITIESLRADHVGCYGYGRDTTPSLDALSREGVLFERAYSVTSWTLASHASIFTGLYPGAHRVIRPHDRLDDSYETLAETLRAAGYQTAGFVSGPFLRTVHNLQQGFDLYDDSGVRVTSSTSANEDVTNPWMEQLLLRFIGGQRDPAKPFFLFAYLWDPHYDYIPPPPYDRMFLPPGAEPIDLRGYENRNIVKPGIRPAQLEYVISQYDGEIRWTDDMLGRLWKRLRALGLWENTVIIVTSDHGEAFFEHGAKGHKNSLHVEEIHVPLVIKPAGRTPMRRDARVANLVDLHPTLLDLAGLRSDRPWHGRSLLDPIDSPQPATFFELETSLYVERPGEKELERRSEEWFAIREGNFVLQALKPKDRWELYDVAADPGERRPLDTGHPAFQPLRLELDAHLAETNQLSSRWRRSEPAKLSPADEDRLRALGYVGGKGPGESGPVTAPGDRGQRGSGR
jgi:arylsulfatase A-like enzyme